LPISANQGPDAVSFHLKSNATPLRFDFAEIGKFAFECEFHFTAGEFTSKNEDVSLTKGKKMTRRRPGFEADMENKRIDELKHEICDSIRKIAIRRGYSQRDLARELRTSEACVSRVIRYRTDQLTVNQLFQYLSTLHPGFEILISV
jgi:ribosome-binding protein aMBF1 (putative translation factor)